MLHWNSRHETGHADLDREHRAIFDQLNAIGLAIRCGAGRDQIVVMIELLQHYALVHFRREEGVMACARCPHHGANCAAHRVFEERLERWLDLLSSSGTPVSVLEDIHTETCRWIESHVVNLDSALRHHQLPGAGQPCAKSA